MPKERPPTPMTPDEVRDARGTLGDMWGKGKPLTRAELGRALKLTGNNPGEAVSDWERGHRPVSGPATVAIEAMLQGFMPKHMGGSPWLTPEQARDDDRFALEIFRIKRPFET